MNCQKVVAACTAAVFLSVVGPAVAAPTAFTISIPLRLGARHANEPVDSPTAGQVRAERRLRLLRYAIQLTDGIVSVLGYRAYATCLSCLAFPSGGLRSSAPLSIADLNGSRPAESNPLVQPFSHGGIASLALGALVFDLTTDQIERHWSIEHRINADLTEIGAHAWGISTWLPELKHIHHEASLAGACGALWQARHFGQAFSDGCVNAFYRPGPAWGAPVNALTVVSVCAPARFRSGTYLFATSENYVVASGAPCPASGTP